MKILTILFSLSISAFARIGESPQECIARYGKPIATGRDVMRHEKAGLHVLVVFHNAKAAALMISKTEKDALGRPVELSEAEIVALINANCGNKAKVIYPETAAQTNIETEDGSIIINYQKFKRTLSIVTKEWGKYAVDEKDREDTDKLDGF